MFHTYKHVWNEKRNYGLMERMVDISYLYSDALEASHSELRGHFEPMIRATQALPEVHVFTAITLRLVRLAQATTLLCKQGLTEESQLQYRSATELIVNLLYIMYVGPSTGQKTQSALAQQFLAYGDLAYAKMLRCRPEQARAAFKKQRGMSDADFDAFLAEKQRLALEAASRHGCTSTRWHNINLADMAKLVKGNAPAFVDGTMADLAFSSFVGANSATHADALSLRSQYNALGNQPLELIYQEDTSYANAVGMEAMWAWKTIAEYYNQSDFLEKCIDTHLRAVLKNRYQAGKPAS